MIEREWKKLGEPFFVPLNDLDPRPPIPSDTIASEDPSIISELAHLESFEESLNLDLVGAQLYFELGSSEDQDSLSGAHWVQQDRRSPITADSAAMSLTENVDSKDEPSEFSSSASSASVSHRIPLTIRLRVRQSSSLDEEDFDPSIDYGVPVEHGPKESNFGKVLTSSLLAKPYIMLGLRGSLQNGYLMTILPMLSEVAELSVARQDTESLAPLCLR